MSYPAFASEQERIQAMPNLQGRAARLAAGKGACCAEAKHVHGCHARLMLCIRVYMLKRLRCTALFHHCSPESMLAAVLRLLSVCLVTRRLCGALLTGHSNRPAFDCRAAARIQCAIQPLHAILQLPATGRAGGCRHWAAGAQGAAQSGGGARRWIGMPAALHGMQ